MIDANGKDGRDERGVDPNSELDLYLASHPGSISSRMIHADGTSQDYVVKTKTGKFRVYDKNTEKFIRELSVHPYEKTHPYR
jgi:hypothetical protein